MSKSNTSKIVIEEIKKESVLTYFFRLNWHKKEVYQRVLYRLFWYTFLFDTSKF